MAKISAWSLAGKRSSENSMVWKSRPVAACQLTSAIGIHAARFLSNRLVAMMAARSQAFQRWLVPHLRFSGESLWLVSPSLHAIIEDLLLVASASKGGLTLALV